MIVAKKIKELSRIVYYTEKPKFYILYEAAEAQITAKNSFVIMLNTQLNCVSLQTEINSTNESY